MTISLATKATNSGIGDWYRDTDRVLFYYGDAKMKENTRGSNPSSLPRNSTTRNLHPALLESLGSWCVVACPFADFEAALFSLADS